MQVKWSEQAVSEAERIVNYIAEHNIAAALEMDDLIRQIRSDFGKNARSGQIWQSSPYPRTGDSQKLCRDL